MARMHARRRGKSCSVRPYRKQAPAWSEHGHKGDREGHPGSEKGRRIERKDRTGSPGPLRRPRCQTCHRQAHRADPEREQGRNRDPRRSPRPDDQGTGLEKAPCREQEGPAQQTPASAVRVQGPPACEVLHGKQETAQRVRVQARPGRDPALQVSQNQSSGYTMSLETAAETVAEQIRRQEFVEVFAHHDADGIAAASILCHAMLRAGIRFRLRVRHEVKPSDLTGDSAYLLCDLGSGREDLPEDDHRGGPPPRAVRRRVPGKPAPCRH